MKTLVQRLNFFKGLFTTPEDWQQEQRYHMGKRELHNRCFHTPGVVSDETGPATDDPDLRKSLRVTVTSAATVTVGPGCAVDGKGRDLYLLEPVELELRPENQDATLYIYITYREELTDERKDRLNPDYDGHAFLEERPLVAWSEQEPDNHERIELARIRWRAGLQLTDDQLDTSHVHRAGTRHWRGLWTRVNAGITASIAPATSWDVTQDDRPYLIQSLPNQEAAAGVLYAANAFPLDAAEPSEARIRWMIVSSAPFAGKVDYHLYIKNFGTKAVRVRYQIYRANVGSPP